MQTAPSPAAPNKNRKARNIATGLAFLTPSLAGFLIFTLVPLILSLVLAFSNWDLRLHNMFKDEPIRFIGLDGFRDLLTSRDFWRYFGNTLFFMMGIPVAIAGNLLLAILLSRDLTGGNRRVYLALLAAAILVTCIVVLTLLGSKTTGIVALMSVLACAMLLLGIVGGTTIYRTLLFLPAFTSGVATYILWTKLYSPHTGPINHLLGPLTDTTTHLVNTLPAPFTQAGMWICYFLLLTISALALRKLRFLWNDGYIGIVPVALGAAALAGPFLALQFWSPAPTAARLTAVFFAGLLVRETWHWRKGPDFAAPADAGIGTALLFSLATMAAGFILLGVGNVFFNLPAMAAEGINPPNWLTDYHWAKPAILIMALWAAIGSQTMLLYIAGLSNIPPDLYEAAKIDGAGSMQTFWHITWPQLAPVTFFVGIMAIISGLQGGFEMAFAMTQGGPAGSTTTLSYFIYQEGFDTGRLGYAAATAWILFAFVFIVTLFNWKFGNRYVND